MGVAQWIPDLSARLKQLESISQLEMFIGVEVWLGGLFFPEAYVTATRQAVAQRNKWSLETLYLNLDIDQPENNSAFVVNGLVLEGAAYKDGKLSLNNGESVHLGRVQIRWEQKLEGDKPAANGKADSSLVNLPVYLNSERSDVMFTVDLPFERGVERLVAIRAVCLTAGN